MFVLSFGRNDSEGMKTIKSEFGGPLSQLISLWRSKSGGHAGREVGLKGGEKKQEKPTLSLPQTCQKPLPPPAPGVSLGVSYTAATS